MYYLKLSDFPNPEEAVAALPAGISSLNLGFNGLSWKTADELEKIFAALPASISSLDLRGNGLGRKTADERAQIFDSIPKHVTTIKWEGGIIQPTPVEQLVSNLSELLRTSTRFPTFNTLKLAEEIDETLLCNYIDFLEKQATPIALFTAALLLDGQIPNHCEEEKNNCDDYIEKRTHDAMTFYIKAAAGDKKLEPLINLLLWEMSTTTNVASLKDRLSCMNLIPPIDFIPSFKEYKTSESRVQRLTLNTTDYSFFKTFRSQMPNRNSIVPTNIKEKTNVSESCYAEDHTDAKVPEEMVFAEGRAPRQKGP